MHGREELSKNFKREIKILHLHEPKSTKNKLVYMECKYFLTHSQQMSLSYRNQSIDF